MLARDVSERIVEIKNDHEKEQTYMTMEELLQDEREEGRAEGFAEGMAKALAVLGVSQETFQQMLKEKDVEL